MPFDEELLPPNLRYIPREEHDSYKSKTSETQMNVKFCKSYLEKYKLGKLFKIKDDKVFLRKGHNIEKEAKNKFQDELLKDIEEHKEKFETDKITIISKSTGVAFWKKTEYQVCCSIPDFNKYMAETHPAEPKTSKEFVKK